MQQTEDACAVIEEPAAPLPARDFAAAWMFLGVLVAVAIFEIWALLHRKDTISQMIQHLARDRPWLKVLGLIGIGVLTWHILWGFFW